MFMVNVKEDFDIQALAENLASLYQTKGYNAMAVKMKKGARVTIEKGSGGLNTILGMDEGICATLMLQGNDTLTVSFSNASWTGKIIGFIAGLLCCIPFITAIVGTVKQLSLPKSIENDLALLVEE